MKTPALIALTMLCSLAILHAGEQPKPAKVATMAAATAKPSGIAVSGPAEGLGFPREYATTLRRVGDAVYDEKFGVTTIFVNELAAATSGFSQERYPNGSVIVMEFAQPQRDGEGEVLRGARGEPFKGQIDTIAVMRRGAGFGAAYGDVRAGEWKFATYRPDGSTLLAPDQAAQCASCHRNAGADKDFVYRIRPWNVAR